MDKGTRPKNKPIVRKSKPRHSTDRNDKEKSTLHEHSSTDSDADIDYFNVYHPVVAKQEVRPPALEVSSGGSLARCSHATPAEPDVRR